MSENAKLFVGDVVPLNLQTTDGNENLFPTAVIFDADGNPTTPATVDLEHVGSGKYIDTDDSLAMPNTPHIHVTYIQYVDAARTIESTYTRGTDIFERNELRPEQLPDGILTGSIDGQKTLKGKTESERVEAKVDSGELTGRVSDPDLVAESETGALKGETETENLDGKIDC